MSITSANATFVLGVVGLFAIPQQIQGFSTDDIYDAPSVKAGETVIGLDGVATSGFVPVLKPFDFTLMGDSASNLLMETWYNTEQALRDRLAAFGIITVPGVGLVYTITNAFLDDYKPLAAAKKTLQPRKYTLLCESIIGAPIP